MLSPDRPTARPLAVVIPARDEASFIGGCLASLAPFAEAGDPVVVVDARSRDGTVTIAERAGATVLKSTDPERGLAVAQGFEAVAGQVESVLIVHADMEVPSAARGRILRALDSFPDAVGGALGHRIGDPRLRFRWIELGNRLRARRWQLPYGDQAQFVRVRAVARAGGFPVVPTLEDLELSLRLREVGPWLYLDCPVRIPARHWAGGVLRTTFRNWRKALSHRARRSTLDIGRSAV